MHHKLHDFATSPDQTTTASKQSDYIISIHCALSVIVLMIFTFQIINDYNLYNSIR